jgi:hypothetical protein
MLPAFAGEGSDSAEGVEPKLVEFGGGSGACAEFGPDAGYELHINNPITGNFEGPDGTTVRITVREKDTLFDYVFLGDDGSAETATMGAYDVIVNGGPQNTWYDNAEQVGILRSDENLHAPVKNPNQTFKLSHINICYDEAPFFCGLETVRTESDGLFRIASLTIFENSLHGCADKLGVFVIDNVTNPPSVTVQFNGDGSATVAGRLDITKQFASLLFGGLTYEKVPAGGFFLLKWCETRDFVSDDTGVSGLPDGTEFTEWLLTLEYPLLPDGESACKVAEEEDLTGRQFTVVYFEFEDPQFR